MGAGGELPGARVDELLRAADETWDDWRREIGPGFQHYIPSDARGALRALEALRHRATSFLEFGSASGAITILADLVGYEAHGIELEPWLVDRARDLAERFGSGAQFAQGSFVPEEAQDEPELLLADWVTPTSGADAYAELGLQLTDVDLVYSYPWPGEEDWTRALVRRFARPDTLLLTYDVTEGFQLWEGDAPPADPLQVRAD